MLRLLEEPSRSFRERLSQEEQALRGVRARAFHFTSGSKDRTRAVVCVAGMGANGRSFVRQRPLAEGHLLLLLNTPTETPEREDPLTFAAEAIEEFVAQQELVHPALLASSFGGAVAATVVLRRRVALSRLILVSPVLARSQIPLAFPGFVNLLEAPRPIANLVTPLAAQIMGGGALDRDARDEIVRESRTFTGTELKRRLRALLHLDLFPRLAEVEVPVLWLHGSRDLLVPWRRARRGAGLFPDARFSLIHGAGHLPYLSHPAPFNQAVGEFLSR